MCGESRRNEHQKARDEAEAKARAEAYERARERQRNRLPAPRIIRDARRGAAEELANQLGPGDYSRVSDNMLFSALYGRGYTWNEQAQAWQGQQAQAYDVPPEFIEWANKRQEAEEQHASD